MEAVVDGVSCLGVRLCHIAQLTIVNTHNLSTLTKYVVFVNASMLSSVVCLLSHVLPSKMAALYLGSTHTSSLSNTSSDIHV